MADFPQDTVLRSLVKYSKPVVVTEKVNPGFKRTKQKKGKSRL